MIQRGNGPFAPHDQSWRRLSRRRFLANSGAGAALLGLGGAALPRLALGAEAMSFLTWCDHIDPRLIGGFEEMTGIKVNAKSYEGTGSALAVKDQSPAGDWDLFCIDFQDTSIVAQQGYLAELDDARVPWDQVFAAIRNQPHTYTDGKLYGIPDKFGYYGVAYDKTRSTRSTPGPPRSCGIRSTRAASRSTTTTFRSSSSSACPRGLRPRTSRWRTWSRRSASRSSRSRPIPRSWATSSRS